ncbi:DinI-like family protein [Enterobacter bugandensis]|uniref:DinI-like family protein n=1 Tax=Enterobacter bugandensis TaxID=881260 RepID=UPI0018884EE8|nr:DinI-like family protein [Enterobacter bugandensis]MBF2801208.1 DinI-like family protein [Enterobacter bugandensis]
MFVELVYDKRNVEGLEGAREIILVELTKRVHQIFPDGRVRQGGVNSVTAFRSGNEPVMR